VSGAGTGTGISTGPRTERALFDAAAECAALSARCRALCERAAAAGADEAEVFGLRSESIAVGFEKDDMKLAQVDDGSTLGLRVFRDGRLGFASTNQAGEAALAAAARDALALAAINPPDPANRLPAASPVPAGPALVRPDTAAVTVERAVEIGRELVGRAKRADARLAIDKGTVRVGRSTRALANTAGADCAESDAAVSLSLFGMAVDGGDVGGFHYCGDVVRDLGRLEPALAQVVHEFVEVSLGNLAARAAESYRGPVLFAPDAFVEALVSPLIAAASAIAVQRGRSALAGRVGEAVADPALSIVDDPGDPTLAGATGFDREGQPARRFELVAQGVLAGYLYNSYAAHVDGVASSGHAAGGARSVPGLGPHALCVGVGTGGDLERMLAALGRGLYVQRFSGTVDPASGDFSGVAKSARWVEGGAIVGSVRETLLSGNAFELLRRLVVLSSAAQRRGGSLRAPHALIDGVSVTAG